MEFEKILNNYIDLLDCTSKELATASELSPAAISRYRNGDRIPNYESKEFNKLISGICQIGKEKNISKINKEKVSHDFYKAYGKNTIDFDVLRDNLNKLIADLNINISKMAHQLGFDPSYISRINSGNRKPSNKEAFINSICKYIVDEYSDNDKKIIIAKTIGTKLNELENNDMYFSKLQDWFFTDKKVILEKVKNFLTMMDTFNLNDYIGTDFSKVKVPTSPVILRNSKIYYGLDGRKQSEAEFIKTTLISKSNEPIYFYNDMPMAEAGKDEDFKHKWVVGITMLLKKGLHLNIIHDIDRPIDEMFLGLESWIPVYMTGSISPFYFKEAPSNLFSHSHCTSGSIALSGECVQGKLDKSKFYLTTRKEELEYYKQKSKYIFSKATPLMAIFKENQKDKFDRFINKEENKKYENVKKDIFNNIDFYIHKDWIAINKLTKPEIHFVIYNEKLKDAIKSFLE